MQLCELTLATPAENLALDEALLELAELLPVGDQGEVLRLWESPQPLVVLGSSSKAGVEANTDACAAAEIPILRRPSGGAAILAGPGCLMYAVVLSYESRPALRSVDAAHHFVLQTISHALLPMSPEVRREGTSDLAVRGVKFSGNALRCRRRHFLYHGTLLYDFPLELIEQFLGTPPRQPDYRAGRDHRRFVGNLPILPANSPTGSDAQEVIEPAGPRDPGGQIRAALAQAFAADQPVANWPREAVARLVSEKYSQPSWNLRY